MDKPGSGLTLGRMLSAIAAEDQDAPAPMPATVAVRVARDPRQLEDWALGLTARGIPAAWRRTDEGFALHVLAIDGEVARAELDAIEAEAFEAAHPPAAPREPELHSRFAPLGGAALALALFGLFWVTGPVASRSVWFAAGASDAARVLAGEWWRTITALTLHADSNHVLSNVALGSVVVTMVMRRTGVGLGAALVVVAGTVGNAINAWGYGAHHSSIGFSTAVFGAIGILGGLTYVTLVRGGADARRGRPAWTAIAGSLALLAMLGTGEHTDLLAHLFGAVAGLAIGVAVGVLRWRPRPLGQALLGLATIAGVAGAWVTALASAA